MTGLQPLRLAEVADIESGSGFPLQHQGRNQEEFPFLKVSDMNLPGNERFICLWNHSVSEATRASLRARAFPPGTVIFPKIGAAIATNKKRILTRPSCVDNNVMGVIPRPGRLDSDYLYYLFRAKDISQFASASNPPSIRKTEVENWVIPIPPLREQQCIVDLLTRAEGIVRLRREAQKKITEIIPALFLDTFGDPATNPKGWPMTTIGDLIAAADYGSSTRASDTGNGLPLIRMGNVGYSGSLALDDLKYVELQPGEAERYRLHLGDLLFNRTNSKELVGKTGVWDGAFDAVVASYFIRIRVKQEVLCPRYLWAFMNSAFMKRRLFDTARGAIGQANINSKELKAFPIAVPPLDAQQLFQRRCEDVVALSVQQAAATVVSEATFNTLLSKAFTPALEKDMRLTFIPSI